MLEQGQEVITKSGKVRGIITGAAVRGKNIIYEVSYFNNNSYQQCWLYAFEFDIDESEKNVPGFSPPSNQLKLAHNPKK